MSNLLVQELSGLFLAFCRIGGCLMLMPGFSNPRIPMQVRLFMAFAATIAVAPIASGLNDIKFTELKPTEFYLMIISEVGLGLLIGLMGRAFYLALQFMAIGAANFIGLGTLPGAPTIDNEPSPPLATLIMLVATLMFFVSNLHFEVLRALIESYVAVPLATVIDAAYSLDRLSKVMTESFQLALQVCSPFVVYGLVVNFSFGLVNKMTPQIPVYFISLPFVIAGGLFLTYSILIQLLPTFLQGFSNWLARV